MCSLPNSTQNSHEILFHLRYLSNNLDCWLSRGYLITEVIGCSSHLITCKWKTVKISPLLPGLLNRVPLYFLSALCSLVIARASPHKFILHLLHLKTQAIYGHFGVSLRMNKHLVVLTYVTLGNIDLIYDLHSICLSQYPHIYVSMYVNTQFPIIYILNVF